MKDSTIGLILLSLTWGVCIAASLYLSGMLTVESDIAIHNYYPLAVLSLPVLAWIWCPFSWVGIKLFEQSKGLGIAHEEVGHS